MGIHDIAKQPTGRFNPPGRFCFSSCAPLQTDCRVDPSHQPSSAAKKLALSEGPRHRHGAGGFTLLELLIVVGIIALAAAALLPALTGARESGRRIRCVANLR
ncbi:MAG: type II secretion system protein [Verrucomicrobiae bacterium]|nr:type II secretion system protein [Verrucomicrobiae bacterium]